MIIFIRKTYSFKVSKEINMKKIISLVLILSVIYGALYIPVGSENISSESADGHILSYHQIDTGVEFPEEKAYSAVKPKGAVFAAAPLPESYSSAELGKITSAKNQGIYGTCWSFAATSCCENALYEKDKSTDLSELQLIYYFFSPKVDPLGNCTGDMTSPVKSTALTAGGNSLFTVWALASWTNGAPESVLPYSSENLKFIKNGGKFDDKYANDYDIAHLQNAYILHYGTSAASLNAIKTMVMEYGSAATSVRFDDDCYDNEHFSYYTDEIDTNHAITIVGWNDSFSKSNFIKEPPADGAWLIKNSWGPDWGTDGDSDPGNSGAEGYFWLSYYDASLIDNDGIYIFRFDNENKYKYNYQYDGSCGSQSLGFSSDQEVANIYTVKGLTAEYERLDAIGVGLSSSNVTGTAYIYTGTTDTDPKSGKLAAEVDFTTTYPGYYTIDIPDAPILKKGENYSIVIHSDSYYAVFIDTSYSFSWIKFTANEIGDRSYLIYTKRNKLSPLSTPNGMTARIKGFTNDVEPHAKSLKISDESIDISVLSKKTLSVLPTPADVRCDWELGDIPDCLSVRICENNTFEIECLAYHDSPITLTFRDKNSGLSAYCTVNITGLPGDINGDGKINAKDVNLMTAIYMGRAPAKNSADLNGDGKISIIDVNTVKSLVLGQR